MGSLTSYWLESLEASIAYPFVRMFCCIGEPLPADLPEMKRSSTIYQKIDAGEIYAQSTAKE